MRFAVFALAALVTAPAVDACLVAVGAHYKPLVWHWLTDHRPPTPPGAEAADIEIVRGIGPRELPNGGYGFNSCGDIGRVLIRFEPSFDGRTPLDEIGYEVRVVSGAAPDGMVDPVPRTMVSFGDEAPYIPLVWIDGATDVQEPLDIGLVIRAVDRGGNRSAPSDTVHVVHPGFAPGEARRDADGQRLG